MIDFSQGGYNGDTIERMFQDFTKKHLPFWWQFREVIRANHMESNHWQDFHGNKLPVKEQQVLVAISLLNYHVYTCLVEALSFFDTLYHEVTKYGSNEIRVFEVRKNWKASYSTLYSSLTALSNLVTIIVGNETTEGIPKNYNVHPAINRLRKVNRNEFADLLSSCQSRLDIRNHLDHYWIIWHGISRGYFLIDQRFEKGYLPTDPFTQVDVKVNAIDRLETDITLLSEEYNSIYKLLSIKGGYLDQFLEGKGWKVDYSDYGRPHFGQRPKP